MLTMLVSASSVRPHFYIVGVPPNASGLHVREQKRSALPLKAILFLTLPLTAIFESAYVGGSGLVCGWWGSVQKGGDYVQLL